MKYIYLTFLTLLLSVNCFAQLPVSTETPEPPPARKHSFSIATGTSTAAIGYEYEYDEMFSIGVKYVKAYLENSTFISGPSSTYKYDARGIGIDISKKIVLYRRLYFRAGVGYNYYVDQDEYSRTCISSVDRYGFSTTDFGCANGKIRSREFTRVLDNEASNHGYNFFASLGLRFSKNFYLDLGVKQTYIEATKSLDGYLSNYLSEGKTNELSIRFSHSFM